MTPRLALAAANCLLVGYWLAVAGSAGCSEPASTTDANVDAGQEDGADGHAGEAGEAGEAGDARFDGEQPEEAVSGPMAFVATSYEVTMERMCDFDGDGIADNALANAGSTSGALILAYLNSNLAGNIDQGLRLVAYLPWVEDRRRLTDPSTTAIIFSGLDTDAPRDERDDFSGEEPFVARHTYLDPCGEPLHVFPEASLDGGTVSASGDIMMLHIEMLVMVPGREPTIAGAVSHDGSASLDVCTYTTIQDVGSTHASAGGMDVTLLEFFVAGGSVAGLPGVPGIQPDVDLDGDGLERLEVGDDGRLESCIDGDTTVIPGRDCWQDPRMTDAIALTVHLDLVPAGFAGLEPGWEHLVEGECTDQPEQSLWDPP